MPSGTTGSDQQDRIPPHNLEAERAALGAVLIHPELINSALELITAEDFFLQSHQLIFSAMVEMYEAEGKVDVIGLKDQLTRSNALERAGGASYLGELIESVSTTANIDYHCQLVFEKALLRRLIGSAETMIDESYHQTDHVDALLERAESALLKLSERRRKGALQPMNALVTSTFDNLSRLFDQKQMITGLETGFPDLDKLTSGLHAGELIIIAARPSIGKTTLGINIIHHIGLKLGRPAAVFSLEMAAEQLVTRILCAEAMVDGQKLRSGFLSRDEWPKVTRAVGRLSKAAIFIDDTPGISVYEIRSKARRLKAMHGLDVILIDYLQLITSNIRYDSRQQEISVISSGLKGLAKEMEVPVIALAQLSREVERRPGKRPQLSDLRESGAIEQDADVVSFLYRPEFYNIPTIEINGREEPSEGRAQLIVAKQRNGPTDTINLAFLRNQMMFRPLLMQPGEGGPEIT